MNRKNCRENQSYNEGLEMINSGGGEFLKKLKLHFFQKLHNKTMSYLEENSSLLVKVDPLPSDLDDFIANVVEKPEVFISVFICYSYNFYHINIVLLY